MPSASEFSTTPDANVTIGGSNVGEGCSPGVINNVLRYLAAVARDTYDRVSVGEPYVPATGGVYTGDISRSGQGAYLHHAGSGQTDGRVMFLTEGSVRPAASEGLVVFYYS